MNFDSIQAAHERIKTRIRATPLLNSPFLDDIAGRRVWVKAECLQITGSFKFRGAYSAISALDPKVRARGVLAFSSGNHAQGVALAARLHGIPAVIIMPEDAPRLKIDNTKGYGAEVIFYDRNGRATREELGEALQAERGLHLIRPYDDPQVIAGQGTAGLELAGQAADAGIKHADVLVCCGGGGLTSGIALALEARADGLRVRPAEPEGFDDVARSLVSGRIESNPVMTGNICDAILTPCPGELTFPILSRLAGPGLAVTEQDCLKAMALAWQRLKIVLEPGGAVSLAAALFHPDQVSGDDVIAVASGGNADTDVFKQALDCAA